MVDSLIGVLRAAGAEDRVCVGSFSDARIERVRAELGPTVCTSSGPRELAKTLVAAYLFPRYRPRQACVQLPTKAFRIALDRPGLIRRLQAMGLQVHYWTINRESDMVRLLDAGADGIMTDEVGLLKTVLQSRGQWNEQP